MKTLFQLSLRIFFTVIWFLAFLWVLQESTNCWFLSFDDPILWFVLLLGAYSLEFHHKYKNKK